MGFASEYGTLKALHSGKVMDITAGSRDNGARLRQWSILDDHPNQQFKFERLDDGFYRIRVQHTNKVLDVFEGAVDLGAAVVQWDWHAVTISDSHARIWAAPSGSRPSTPSSSLMSPKVQTATEHKSSSGKRRAGRTSCGGTYVCCQRSSKSPLLRPTSSPSQPCGSVTGVISAPQVQRYAALALGQWHSDSTRSRHPQSS